MDKILKDCGISKDMTEILCEIVKTRHNGNAPETYKDFAADLELFAGFLVSVAHKVQTYHHKTSQEVCESLAELRQKQITLEQEKYQELNPIQEAMLDDSLPPPKHNGNGGQGAKLRPDQPINPNGPPSIANDADLILNLTK